MQAEATQARREVIDVETITQACIFLRRLNYGDAAVAVVSAVSFYAVQDAKGFDGAAIQSDDLVAVFRFSSVSVVHCCFVVVDATGIRRKSWALMRSGGLGVLRRRGFEQLAAIGRHVLTFGVGFAVHVVVFQRLDERFQI